MLRQTGNAENPLRFGCGRGIHSSLGRLRYGLTEKRLDQRFRRSSRKRKTCQRRTTIIRRFTFGFQCFHPEHQFGWVSRFFGWTGCILAAQKQQGCPESSNRKNIISGLQLFSGAILSVFAKGNRLLRTPTALIGIKGTGAYLEFD